MQDKAQDNKEGSNNKPTSGNSAAVAPADVRTKMINKKARRKMCPLQMLVIVDIRDMISPSVLLMQQLYDRASMNITRGYVQNQ